MPDGQLAFRSKLAISRWGCGSSTSGRALERVHRATGHARVHVGASLFHDVAPRRQPGLASIWNYRLGERAEPEPNAGADRPLEARLRPSTSRRRHEAEVRPPSEDEAHVATELLAEHALAAFGERQLAKSEVWSWFSVPKFGCGLPSGRGGSSAGSCRARGGRALQYRRSFAGARRRDRARRGRRGARALRGVRSAGAAGIVQGTSRVLREVYDSAGWRMVRHSFEMRIELADDLPKPSWPDGLSPRNFLTGEDDRVYEANMDAFADHWDFVGGRRRSGATTPSTTTTSIRRSGGWWTTVTIWRPSH